MEHLPQARVPLQSSCVVEPNGPTGKLQAAAPNRAVTKALWAALPGHLAPDYEGLKVLALHAHNPALVHTRDKALAGTADLSGMRNVSDS